MQTHVKRVDSTVTYALHRRRLVVVVKSYLLKLSHLLSNCKLMHRSHSVVACQLWSAIFIIDGLWVDINNRVFIITKRGYTGRCCPWMEVSARWFRRHIAAGLIYCSRLSTSCCALTWQITLMYWCADEIRLKQVGLVRYFSLLRFWPVGDFDSWVLFSNCFNICLSKCSLKWIVSRRLVAPFQVRSSRLHCFLLK